MADVTVPENLWDDDLEGAVSVWFFEDGDKVSAGDVLCEVMVEKSTFEILAPESGTLTISVEAEVPLNKGDTIARVD